MVFYFVNMILEAKYLHCRNIFCRKAFQYVGDQETRLSHHSIADSSYFDGTYSVGLNAFRFNTILSFRAFSSVHDAPLKNIYTT
jgi:hypothetical protein